MKKLVWVGDWICRNQVDPMELWLNGDSRSKIKESKPLNPG